MKANVKQVKYDYGTFKVQIPEDTTKEYTEIPKRLKCINYDTPYVCGTEDVIDDESQLTQAQINEQLENGQETINEEIHGTGGINDRLDSIEAAESITYDGGEAQIAQGSDFTNPDATKKAKVPTVGAILDGLNDGIYDVSKRFPTGGPNSDGKFTLEYILNNADTLIPTSWRHGGMSIQFVQIPDNKYVQYRLMTTTWSTTESDWQGVDEEPTAGSHNLVESGGPYNSELLIKLNVTGIIDSSDFITSGVSYYNSSGVEQTDANRKRTALIKVSQGDVFKYTIGNVSITLMIAAFNGNKAIDLSNSVAGTNSVATGTYTVPSGVSYLQFCAQTTNSPSVRKTNNYADDTPQENSEKLVRSGGVYKGLKERVEKFSDNETVNKYIVCFWTENTTIDISEIDKVRIGIAVQDGTKYDNYIYFMDGTTNIAYYLEKFDTAADAIAAFTGILNDSTRDLYVLVNNVTEAATLSLTPVIILNNNSTIARKLFEYDGYKPEIEKIGNDVDTLQESMDSIIVTSVNLFDKTNVINGWWGSSFNEDNAYRSTGNIAVEAGKSYKFLCQANFGGNRAKFAKYDINGDYIGVSTGTVDNDGFSIIEIPTGTFFVRVNIGAPALVDSFMFTEASKYPQTYVPYSRSIDPDLIAESNPLFGKKISVNGDSMMYGAGYTGGFAKIIADRNQMGYQNIAVNGATVVTGTYNDTEHTRPRHWICDTITNMDSDADYIIIDGGTNDATVKENDEYIVELGTLSQGYNAAFDKTTFYGAFEYMLKQLTIRFAGKKYGYVFLHRMSGRFSSMGNDANFYWAARKCLEKWAVPYIDLSQEIPPFALFTSDGDANLYAIRETYTDNADGWHCNEEGYKKYYCDKVEAWMKTL